MGLLDIFRKKEKRFHPSTAISGDSAFWLGKNSDTGVSVTRETALSSTPVYAAVTLIADSVSSVPCIVYESTSDDQGRQVNKRATNSSLYRLLHDAPNRWQNRQQYFELVAGHLLLTGNHFAAKIRNNRGEVIELHPLLPHLVDIEVTDDMRFLYHYKISDSEVRTFRRDQIFHVAGFGYDGVRGYSPITLHREAIGLNLAAEKFTAKTYSNYGRPGGILSHPGPLEDEEVEAIKTSWQNAHGGLDNAHKIAFIQGELNWQATSLSNEDLEFLESRKFTVNEIARIFRVPPPFLQDLERATFSNIEELGHFFRDFTIRPFVVRIEEAIKKDLVPAKSQGKLYAKFKLEALFRANIATRYDAYGEAIRDGWLSRNEVRIAEDMNPVDGLDEHLLPLNMLEQSEAQDVDESEDEFTQEDDRSGLFRPLLGDALRRYKNLESQRLEKAQKRGLCPNETRAECIERLFEIISPVFVAYVGSDELAHKFTEEYNEEMSVDDAVELFFEVNK